MILVSDTSALSNLIVIGRLDLLKQMFHTVVIPNSVVEELSQLERFSIDMTSYKEAYWIKAMEIHDKVFYNELISRLDAGGSGGNYLS